MHKRQKMEGVTDSKKLSDLRRRKLTPLIQEEAIYYHVEFVTVSDIRTKSHGRAWVDGVYALVKKTLADTELLGIDRTLLEIIVDGSVNKKLAKRIKDDLNMRTVFQPKADSTVLAVGAASILAKTYRNDAMIALGKRYPEYGFEKHAGYGTEEHFMAMLNHGRTTQHRPCTDHYTLIDRE